MAKEESQVYRLGELDGRSGVWQAGALRIVGPLSADGPELHPDRSALAGRSILLSGLRQLRAGGRTNRQGPRFRSCKVQQAMRGHGLAIPFASVEKSTSIAQRLQPRIAAHLHLPPQLRQAG